ncbi:MAG TPA: DNA-binding response regulator [Lachnospiraceae bacterium]|nr:DNA-binding response regulator [Lachnospiraceae bacterium]
MFRIAICDDESVICSQIETVILNYAAENNLKVEIQVFYSGEELYRFLERGQNFDLLFLDIELKLINGIEVGRKIRENLDNQIMQIVYISGKDSYYLDLFEVRPMHFLPKPIKAAEIIKDLRLAMKLTDKLGGIFIYKKSRETYRKAVKDILYFESLNREVKIVSTEGEDQFYGKLDNVFEQMAKYQFLYIHKSYIVNYFHVTKFKYEEVTMSNAVVLPISQSRRKETRELQIRYEREGVE